MAKAFSAAGPRSSALSASPSARIAHRPAKSFPTRTPLLGTLQSLPISCYIPEPGTFRASEFRKELGGVARESPGQLDFWAAQLTSAKACVESEPHLGTGDLIDQGTTQHRVRSDGAAPRSVFCATNAFWRHCNGEKRNPGQKARNDSGF